MSTVTFSRWSGLLAAAALVVSLPRDAHAQFVQDVDGLIVRTYIFDCCPSDLTVTNNYPSLAKFDEQFTGAQSGADASNRHEFLFYTDDDMLSGPRIFNNNDSFDISMDMVLEAGINVPRKEAGFRSNRSFQDGRFIVTSDETGQVGGEIVAFGGPFPFYSFDDVYGIRYTPGTPISLRMIYNAPTGPGCLETPGNCGTMQYMVEYLGNSYDSGEIPFGNTEGGIVNGNQVGAYMQATASPSNPTADFGIATFSNFVFGTGETGLDGDFNGDGLVDAADYVALRKDNLPQVDYDAFFQNFGETQAGAGGSGGVPEPTALTLALFASLSMLGLVRRRY